MATVTPISYFKRYRMETDLEAATIETVQPTKPQPGYAFLPWEDRLLDAHAEALYRSFHQEIDALVFPSLSTREGCKGLMTAIRKRWDFLPTATWLLVGPEGPCGSIQGLRETSDAGWERRRSIRQLGAIQNVGVIPTARGRGMGRALLLRALRGFLQVGLRHAMLEVTAQNEVALRLYSQLGFRRRKILYRVAPVPVGAHGGHPRTGHLAGGLRSHTGELVAPDHLGNLRLALAPPLPWLRRLRSFLTTPTRLARAALRAEPLLEPFDAGSPRSMHPSD